MNRRLPVKKFTIAEACRIKLTFAGPTNTKIGIYYKQVVNYVLPIFQTRQTEMVIDVIAGDYFIVLIKSNFVFPYGGGPPIFFNPAAGF